MKTVIENRKRIADNKLVTNILKTSQEKIISERSEQQKDTRRKRKKKAECCR